MALRDQPYLPLYVQDVLTDEKLILCSAESHGIYFRLLCILHKQEIYGKIILKQKYKQNKSKYENFAMLLCRQMPFEQKQIIDSLIELDEEKVITITETELCQKRMVYDGNLSLIRSETGKKGGSNVTKQYGKSGYLYLMSDGFEKNKIGISVNPQNRLYRLRSDLKLPKHFDIVEQVSVKDMGKSEDYAQSFFKDCIDGEWLIGKYEDLKIKFDLLKANLEAKPKAKSKANTEYEIEYENEYVFTVFKEWLNYKKERGEKYKTNSSAQTAFNNLVKYSDNDPVKAKLIIDQSIGNNWAGIFELKNQNRIAQTKANIPNHLKNWVQ
jgi:hypothetical protein